MSSEVIAITAGDIHISNCPSARSAEPSWFAVMKRQFDELRELQNHHNVPIVYAGDIFHKYNASPELINFAIENLPAGYSIPGQHDLPDHRMDQIKKSAYHTLCEAEILWNLEQPKHIYHGLLKAHPFPWGSEITPLTREERSPESSVHLAVVHSYIWKEGCNYVGADKNQEYSGYMLKLQGYDAAVFGDNHISFSVDGAGTVNTIFNGGTFFRRRTDERDHRPQVGLLHSDGKIVPYCLQSCAVDLFIDEDDTIDTSERVSEIVEAVRSLKTIGQGQVIDDFVESVNHALNQLKVDDTVRKLVLDAVIKKVV